MSSRRKGTEFERQVADIWRSAGHTVRGLEAAGDHLIITPGGLVLHSECKRQERLRLPEWWEQTIRDCPTGAVPMLALRWSHGQPLCVMRLPFIAHILSTGREDG